MGCTVFNCYFKFVIKYIFNCYGLSDLRIAYLRSKDPMNSMSKTFASIVFLIAAVSTLASPSMADTFATKPIRVIVGFAPGGSADAVARVLQPKLAERLKQPLIIENRPGGGGTVATEVLVKSPPDGHVISYATMGALSVNQFLGKLNYDPLNDVAPLSVGAVFTNILVVNSQSDIKTLADYVRKGKVRNSNLHFGSAGIGTINHLAGEMLKLRAGLSGDHVSYRSGALAINDLLGGSLPSMFGSPVDVLAHIESGKLRAIATTGLKRHESLPNVPTVAESGYPGFEALNWSAFIAPKQTPIGTIRQLNLAIVAELSDPATVEQLKKMGLDAAPSTPEEAGAFIRREAAKWGDIVKQTGIKVD